MYRHTRIKNIGKNCIMIHTEHIQYIRRIYPLCFNILLQICVLPITRTIARTIFLKGFEILRLYNITLNFNGRSLKCVTHHIRYLLCLKTLNYFRKVLFCLSSSQRHYFEQEIQNP